MATLLEGGTTLRVEEVTDAEELEALRPEWSALWERAPSATPFQSPEWLLPWWRRFGGEGLWTLALRRDGELAGLAPLFVYIDPGAGTRQVTLVGNGLTDHLGVLLAPELVEEGAAALLAHLAERRDRWDVCDFRDLPEASPLLIASLPEALAAETSAEEPSPALSLPPSVERLEEAVPAKLLKKLDYYRRRAGREGGLQVEAAGEEDAGSAFDTLAGLHRARWAERGEPGVLDGPGVEAFHREVISGFAARGWLRLYTLHVGGRVAASHYGFLARGRAYYYLGGFDPEFDKLGPGNLVVRHAIEDAVRAGAREFDFLRGREAYKYSWGAEDRPKHRLRLRKAGG